ncbi:MAG: Gfo/Idh/MocA family oxidoreductase [Anaerolineaceae bacterium]
MKTKTRWGILSTATINRQLIPAIKGHRDSDLVAIASRSVDKAEAAAKQWKIPKFYGSYQALLDDPDIDIIYNPLPNHLHCEWTIKAAQAGKHVLVEKPIALSAAEVDEMISVAEKYKVIIQEAFMYRFNPQTDKVAQLVSSGAVGKIRYLRSSFQHFHHREGDFRQLPEAGGGALWDLGCYPISYFQLLTKTSPMNGFGTGIIASTGVDNTFFGTLNYPDDITAHFSCSFDLPAYAMLEVHGTEGIMTIASPYKPRDRTLVILRQGNGYQSFSFSTKDVAMGEVENMVQASRGNQPVRVSLLESKEIVKTIMLLQRSANLINVVSMDQE